MGIFEIEEVKLKILFMKKLILFKFTGLQFVNAFMFHNLLKYFNELSVLILFAFLFSSANVFAQNETVEIPTYNGEYETGFVNTYNIKNDGDIKAGTAFSNSFKGWARWNLTEVPTYAQIISVKVKYYVAEGSDDENFILDFEEMTVDPIGSSGSEIWNDIGSNTEYSWKDLGTSTGYFTEDLGSDAEEDLQNTNNSSTPYFFLGFEEYQNDNERILIDGHDDSFNEPILIVTYCEYSTPPSGANASTNPICEDNSTTLNVEGGELGTGAEWHWYTGSCGGTHIGTGSSIEVSPSTTTTYYVRAEGSCNTSATLTCEDVTVNVNPKPGEAGIIDGPSSPCEGSSQIYSINSVSNADSYDWDIPDDWSGSSTATSITVNVGVEQGDVTVIPENSCGFGGSSSKPVDPKNCNVDITLSANPYEGGNPSGGGTYTEGDEITVHANTNNDYVFDNWTENGTEVSTNSDYTFTVPAENRNLTANYNPKYTISLSSNPSEGGSVSGGGTYEEGTEITVSATSNSGYVFDNWTKNGTEVSTNKDYTFTVIEDRNLTANFTQEYTISLSSNPSEGGSVSGGGTYEEGTEITISATSSSGYGFDNWTEDGTEVSTNKDYTFTVTEDRNLTANFTPGYTISLSANPSVGGSVSGGGTYEEGAEITISATSNSGYVFDNWTEDGTEVSTNKDYTFTITEERYLTANYTPEYTISLSADPSEGGSVSGGGTYEEGTEITISATSNSGYVFDNWTENGTEVSTNSDYTFTVTEVRNLTANFTILEYDISLSADPPEGGNVSGGGTYEEGSEVTVSATSNSGYVFDNWTEDGTEVSSNSDYSFAVQNDRALTANFSEPNDIEDISYKDGKIEIYPNPVKDRLYIQTENIEDEMKGIEIYNSVGAKIKSVGTNKVSSELTEIKVSSLESGIYIVEMRFDETIISEQIIIE